MSQHYAMEILVHVTSMLQEKIFSRQLKRVVFSACNVALNFRNTAIIMYLYLYDLN